MGKQGFQPGNTFASKQYKTRPRLITAAIIRELEKMNKKHPKKTNIEVLVESLVDQACNRKDLHAQREVIDRVEGKAIQAVQHVDDDGNSMPFPSLTIKFAEDPKKKKRK